MSDPPWLPVIKHASRHFQTAATAERGSVTRSSVPRHRMSGENRQRLEDLDVAAARRAAVGSASTVWATPLDTATEGVKPWGVRRPCRVNAELQTVRPAPGG
jgi:hypothetical protein